MLAVKLAVPPLKNVEVPRDRLLRRLEASRARLCVVVAPAVAAAVGARRPHRRRTGGGAVPWWSSQGPFRGICDVEQHEQTGADIPQLGQQGA